MTKWFGIWLRQGKDDDCDQALRLHIKIPIFQEPILKSYFVFLFSYRHLGALKLNELRRLVLLFLSSASKKGRSK